MSLKHKNTSKWAKQQKIYAQYSERSKDLVQEQLELSKKLTQRVKEFEVGEDSSGDENDATRDERAAASGAVEALNKKGL
jgi:U3 small nucleolar RNA-associated protein 14